MATASAEHRPRRAEPRALAAIAAALSLFSCTPSGEPRAATGARPGDAEESARVSAVVRVLIDAMHDHDCARIEPLIDGAIRARMEAHGGCARVVTDQPGTLDLTILRLDPPRRDGRDPRAWIVPALLRGETDEQVVQIRVEERRGRHFVVAM